MLVRCVCLSVFLSVCLVRLVIRYLSGLLLLLLPRSWVRVEPLAKIMQNVPRVLTLRRAPRTHVRRVLSSLLRIKRKLEPVPRSVFHSRQKGVVDRRF